MAQVESIRVHTTASAARVDLLIEDFDDEDGAQVEVVVVERASAKTNGGTADAPTAPSSVDRRTPSQDDHGAAQQLRCSPNSASVGGFSTSQVAGEYPIRERGEKARRRQEAAQGRMREKPHLRLSTDALQQQAGSGSTDGARSPRRGAHQPHYRSAHGPSSPRMHNAAMREDMVKRGGVNGEDAGMTRREARGFSGERLPIPSSSPSTTLGMPTSEPKQAPTEESTRRHSASSLKASSPLPLGHHHRRYRQYQQAQPHHFSQELPLGAGSKAQEQAGLSYHSPQVRARSTSAEDIRTQKRSRSGDFSRILSTAPPSPLTSRAPANGSKAWACDQRGNCEPEAPQFPSSFYIERMETLISLTGMKFITAELHTATIERTKKSDSDESPEVGETSWTTPTTESAADAEQLPETSIDEKAGRERDRSAKRLQKEEEFFRLFLHYGSYSAPSFASPSPAPGQRPRASTVTGATPIPNGSASDHTTSASYISAPPVFEDQRECRFFSKRERAEKFYCHLIQELTKSGYKKVFIPPSPLMGSYEAQLQLSRGGELFKLVELCSMPASTLTPSQQSKIAKEILHILKNSPPSSPISKTIQSKSVVRYLLKNAFFNLFPVSSSSSSTSSSTSSTSTAPPSTSTSSETVPPASPSLSSLRRVGRILNPAPSFSPSVQSWRARGEGSISKSSSQPTESSQPDKTRSQTATEQSINSPQEKESAPNTEKVNEPASRESEQSETDRRVPPKAVQPEREKRDRSLIERWRKTLFRIIDIIRENREEGYYTDDQDFNNTHFIKELTQSDLSPCYLYCLLKPFISSQFNTSGAFGFERLSSVEWVLQLVRLNNPLLDQFITFNFYNSKSSNSNLLFYCLDSLFKFPRNNILHNLICDMITSIFARDEKRKKRDRKLSVSSRSGCYSITTSSGSIATIRDQRASNFFASTSGNYRYGKLNRKLGKFKRVDPDREEDERMDIEVIAQLSPEEDIEDSEELKARREKMARKWAKDTMKLKRVALIDCLLLERLVSYFHGLREERQRREQTRRSMETEATVAVDERPESEALASPSAMDSTVDLETNDDSNATSSSPPDPSALREDDPSDFADEPGSPSSSSSSSSSTEEGMATSGMKRVIAGAAWAGEENLGPVVKIANRVLRGRHNQHLGCSAHLLTQILGVDEQLARAWLDIVHTDLREINMLENSRPFEKPHVSFASPLKNSFDNYHLNLLKLHRR